MKNRSTTRDAGSHRALTGALAGCLLGLAATACGGGSNPATSSGGALTMVRQVPNEGWDHVVEGAVVNYRNNPPASGPHYPSWARYQEFTVAVARGYWVHNLEHGAVVFLYRPDAPAATVGALRDAFRSVPADPQCGHGRALMTPDSALPRAIAVVAADWVLESDVVEPSVIRDFVLARRNRAPENVCDHGTRP
jgi:hypothetical protein